MAPIIKGNTLETLFELCQGHHFRKNANGLEELEISYAVKWANRLTQIPEVGTSASAAGHPKLFLSEYSIDRDEAGQAAVTLFYRGDTFSIDGLPQPSYHLGGGGQEIPIQQHPDFKTILSLQGWDDENQRFAEGSKYYGIESFLAGGGTWTETSYRFLSPSESDFERRGKISTPKGLRNSTNLCWIFDDLDVSSQGSFWCYRKTWMFNPAGWDPDIYG